MSLRSVFKGAVLVTASAALIVVTHDRQMLADLADWPRLDIGRAAAPLGA